MATIQKRKNSWRVQVRRQGKAVSATFDTKAEAEIWAIKAEGKILEGVPPSAIINSPVPQAGETAADVFERYGNEASPKKRGGRWGQIRLKGMVRRFHMFDRPITAITGPHIAEWRDIRLLSVSASTVNREISLISTVFTHAMKEWRLGLTSNPCMLVAKPRKARPRTQRISITERKQIIGQLGWDTIHSFSPLPNATEHAASTKTRFPISLAIYAAGARKDNSGADPRERRAMARNIKPISAPLLAENPGPRDSALRCRS